MVTKMIKKIKVNWLSLDSIRKAERIKLKLENKGYTLMTIKKLNSNEDMLIYKKTRGRK